MKKRHSIKKAVLLAGVFVIMLFPVSCRSSSRMWNSRLNALQKESDREIAYRCDADLYYDGQWISLRKALKTNGEDWCSDHDGTYLKPIAVVDDVIMLVYIQENSEKEDGTDPYRWILASYSVKSKKISRITSFLSGEGSFEDTFSNMEGKLDQFNFHNPIFRRGAYCWDRKILVTDGQSLMEYDIESGGVDISEFHWAGVSVPQLYSEYVGHWWKDGIVSERIYNKEDHTSRVFSTIEGLESSEAFRTMMLLEEEMRSNRSLRLRWLNLEYADKTYYITVTLTASSIDYCTFVYEYEYASNTCKYVGNCRRFYDVFNVVPVIKTM